MNFQKKFFNIYECVCVYIYYIYTVLFYGGYNHTINNLLCVFFLIFSILQPPDAINNLDLL